MQHKLVRQLKGSTMTPVLYYLPPSPPCRSVLLLAKMLDIDLELKVINIMDGEQMKPDFVEMNPQHCVPTLKDNGLILWESRSILSYLVSAYGKDDALYPKDVRTRALVDQRMMFDLAVLYQRLLEYFFPTMVMGAPLDESKKAKLNEAIGWFDKMLKGRSFVAADHFTIADLTLLVTVSQMEAFMFDLHSFHHINQWLQRCKDFMQPYDYEEINGSKAKILAEMFRAKLQK